MSEEQYEKDKNKVMIQLGVALQQIGIGYPDIAFECIEKAQKRLSKYVGITEEQRKHLKELEYDPESSLLVSTDPKEKDSAGGSVARKKSITKYDGLLRYKGRAVDPDLYKVVEGKLYFKDPHEDCGGDILVTECMGWDHGHAQCTKCGKIIGGWISGADNRPFYGSKK